MESLTSLRFATNNIFNNMVLWGWIARGYCFYPRKAIFLEIKKVRFIFLDAFSSFWIINLRIHRQIKQNNYPYVKFFFQKDASLIIFNFHFPKKLPKQAFFCSFGQFPHQTKQVAVLPAYFSQLSWPDSFFLSFSFFFSLLAKLSKLPCSPLISQSCPSRTAAFFLYFSILTSLQDFRLLHFFFLL